MNFHSRYYSNADAKENGTWVDLGGGLKIKVRALDSTHSRETRRKLEEPYSALIRSTGSLPDDKAEEVMTKQLAQSIVVDWQGVTEEDGAPLPFSPAAAEKMFQKYPDFRSEVAMIITDRSTFKRQAQEADLKNS